MHSIILHCHLRVSSTNRGQWWFNLTKGSIQHIPKFAKYQNSLESRSVVVQLNKGFDSTKPKFAIDQNPPKCS